MIRNSWKKAENTYKVKESKYEFRNQNRKVFSSI